ncbi:hypothetical protein HMPREF2531_01793 [Bacteroides intestinalis]|uniref:Uncharacterized protein n=1 Tax=Bacteroides intestinalis TaxID=329854 RepID=A0A139LK20_9BACE|nr:hypothetical protein HMPREF2531_01793 [Bacteroides intestinalis]
MSHIRIVPEPYLGRTCSVPSSVRGPLYGEATELVRSKYGSGYAA